ncbi:phosphodiester glycosidase family protein [Aestuariicoccus sp. MJ-SS9]|nr:phosphodiester glycosidase family protein [Aestuariicoccus sp. MJ-SS9]MDU8911348.1 phosphodiester glycosidase family protein [Aestuariicoccus sp. MJ-SS9]
MCREDRFNGTNYTLCEIDPAEDDLRLFLYDEQGVLYGQFQRIDAALEAQGKRLEIAMNGGMYHDDRAPVGHYVENGQEIMRVIPNAGPGNFGLLPNGVFCIGDGRADVIETLRYLEESPACRFATQSGPMLVIDGALHPRFLPDSTSRYIRNGVGTSADGTRVVLAISDEAVTFHQFGRLFRDHLALPQALFLDGNVSRLYAPALGRSDLGRYMGPILGVVTNR